MLVPQRRVIRWLSQLVGMLALTASAQTINLTGGVQTFDALTNTTATLTGASELHLTATNSPLSGCTINLNSADAWLLFTGIKPSVVVSSYLGQIKVNGASAVADSNVRVVQYGPGTVVIPQASSFQPLQVFSGPYFTGSSAKYNQWTYYTGTGLGTMYLNISSFKLKRGYMAVVAQNTSGSGYSKCYVAQDGDLEVSVLPAALDNRIRFIYVTPWRWVSKKGIAGDPGLGLLNVGSWYNWNISSSSTRDLEYVAIEQQPYWPGLGQSWQSLGINTLLGYNEPDNSSQDAYKNLSPPGSISDAVAKWPGLLATGLRLGSPATTDGGRSSWLYPFVSQADAAGARVDFIAVHYYQAHNPADASGCASQMYSFLLDIWNHTHRPIWITEWNNGANWTDGTWPAPTYAQQQACVAAMLSMLESTPFVERYQLYNWVEDARAVVTNGVLTPAGVTYRDLVSAVSYQQALPDNGTRGIAQYFFETNMLDSSGYANNAMAAISPAYGTGHSGQAVMLDGTNNCVQLPANIATGASFSFAAWVNWNGGGIWQRIFDFGSDTTHYLFLTPSSGSGTLRFAIRNGGSEQLIETAGLTPGQWQHVAVTLGGGVTKIYTNGVLAVTSSAITITPSNFAPMRNFLGRSQFATDPLYQGSLDDVQIADSVFTAAQIAALQTNQPPQFTSSLIDRGTAAPYVEFAGTIAGTATDADSGDTLTYSKATGLSWLTVNADGTFSGTPGSTDGGTNYFSVRVTDSAGASAAAILTIYVPITYGNGTWSSDSDGTWGETNNWTAGAVANGAGYTADFSTLNITANRTVTLDEPRSIGTLKFGDTSGAQNWTLTSGGEAVTLDSGSSAIPSIVVNQNTATISAPLEGENGFGKSGTGTLILAAANPLSGTINIDTSSTTTAEGIVRAAHPAALVSVTNIAIRDNNSGSSTLQLDGSAGDIATASAISLNGRNVNVAAIQNLSGSNAISGLTTLASGGGSYIFQSDANSTLQLGGITIGSTITTLRTLTFQGGGDFLVSGVIQNGNSTNHITKTGAGTLTLAGANTHTGTNRITGGKIVLANTLAMQSSTLDLNAADSGTLSFGSLTTARLGGLTGTRALSLLNTSSAPVTLTFGANNLSLGYSGSLTGSGGIEKTGSGTQTLSATSTFTGTTRVTGGSLLLGSSTALLNSTVILENGTVNFGSQSSVTFGGLGGAINLGLTNASGSAVTLNVGGNSQDSAYAGKLSGPGSLVKSGAGTLVLSGASTYTGNTTLAAGTIRLSRDPVLKMSFDSVSGSTGGSVVTNEGTGGSVMNGTVNNGSTGLSFVSGKVGNALNLAGDGSYVGVASRVTAFDGNTPGADWTMAMWIKTTQAGAGYAYQGNGGWASGNTAFYLNQGNTTSGTRVGAVRWAGGWLTGNASVNNGAWRFIAITAANGTKSIYIDGNLDSTTASWVNASVGDQFWIGGTADSGDGVAKMNGQIDEVSVFNRALSIAEVRALTNSAVTLAGAYGGQLPTLTSLAISSGATFDLGGNYQTLASVADYSGGGTVTNSGATDAILTLAASSGTKTFSGVIADGVSSGAISLVKNGGASLILSGANQVRGATTLSAGNLLIDGTLGSGTVTVSAGTLGGNGALGGTVAIQSGGTLAPGNGGIGALAISNSLSLAGTTLIELSKTGAATNDSVYGLSSVSLGGTLTVTSLGGSFAAGDTFRLFSAASYSGAFANVNLPTLGEGLAWNTSNLTNGILSVVTLQPQIADFNYNADGSFRISGTGNAGQGYTLEGATNLAPVTWEVITNVITDGSGNFLLIDSLATNYPCRFYRVRTP